MTYNKLLSRIDNIHWLIVLARPFPVTAGEISSLAESWKFGSSTINFLNRFPADEIFENEVDFLNRTEELETIISEERKMPIEFLHNPLD